MTRTLLLLLAALGVIAAITIPLAVQAWDEEDADPTSAARTRDTQPVGEPTPVEEPPSTEPSGASRIGTEASPSPEPTNSASENTSPTGSASASGEAPAANLQPPPALGELAPSTRFAQVELTGLREDIQAGLSYEVILTFERAGQVRMTLPVGYPAEPRPPAEEE